MHAALLPTKLYRPRVLPQQVQRPYLLQRLNQGVAAGRHLTLVVAPAGFGKSTLISQWAEQNAESAACAQTGHPANSSPGMLVAWLSLDEHDNELPLFLHYWVAAVRQIFPAACSPTQNLLQAPQLAPIHLLIHTLLHDLSEINQPFVLVLDDYHCITDAAIHQLLMRLLAQPPDRLHLVLISRTEPPLPLARLRMQQQMTELRAADLCFSAAETQTLLTQTLGRLPNEETIATLHNQTEGWIAGLQLAAFSLRAQTDETAFVRTFAVNNQYVMDYLLEEVLTHQSPSVQAFLTHTAILDRFCVSLCEALVSEGRLPGRSEVRASQTVKEAGVKRLSGSLPGSLAASQTILNYLVQANLFVIPLDERGEWHRYHHLFQRLLRRRLHTSTSAAELAALHRRASAWLADHGWIEEAIQHALAGGDELAAAQLVAERRHNLLNREDWRTLARWLALLPETLVQQHAALLVTKALVFNVQFKLAAIPPLLQAAAGALNMHLHDPALGEADAQVLRAEIDALASQNWYWQNEGQRSLAAAQQALEHLPADWLYARSGALLYLGLAAQMTGQLGMAQQTLRAGLAAQQAYPSTFVTRVLYALAIIHYLAGELTLMHQIAEDCLQAATRANLNLARGWAHYWLGVVHYEWNELESAAHHFAAVVDLRYSVNVLTAHNGWLGLAWTQQAQGRPDQAQQQVTALLHFHHEMNNLAFLPLVHAFQARLALQQGDAPAALRWAQAANLGPAREPLLFAEHPSLTRVKILLAQAAPNGAPGGPLHPGVPLAALAQLRQVAESTHNTMRLIELLALQALAEAAQGKSEAALTTLQQALLLAQPGRFIRTFVDLGPQLAALLYQLAASRGLPGVATAYVRQILAAFPPTVGAADPAQHIRRAAQANLIAPLTERESEVLLYLQQGLPNKAIARTLNISALTVKKHTINLYQKLGVNSRQQAIARARSLGILPLDGA